MRLYLVQHGEARDEAEDPRRPLTPRGRDDVARVAEFARQAGVEVRQIWHSGKLRAEETAILMGSHLAPRAGVLAVPGLAPKDDVKAMAERLARESGPLMLVGHLPFLERLSGLLLTGEPDRVVVRFRRGGLVCLDGDPASASWAVEWAITPELLHRAT